MSYRVSIDSVTDCTATSNTAALCPTLNPRAATTFCAAFSAAESVSCGEAPALCACCTASSAAFVAACAQPLANSACFAEAAWASATILASRTAVVEPVAAMASAAAAAFPAANAALASSAALELLENLLELSDEELPELLEGLLELPEEELLSRPDEVAPTTARRRASMEGVLELPEEELLSKPDEELPELLLEGLPELACCSSDFLARSSARLHLSSKPRTLFSSDFASSALSSAIRALPTRSFSVCLSDFDASPRT